MLCLFVARGSTQAWHTQEARTNRYHSAILSCSQPVFVLSLEDSHTLHVRLLVRAVSGRCLFGTVRNFVLVIDWQIVVIDRTYATWYSPGVCWNMAQSTQRWLKSVIETFRTVYSTHESGVPEHVRFESGAGFWHLSFSVCELCVRSDEGRG